MKGFSLIEALVSLAIILVLGFILSDLLLHTFQGGNKSDLIGTVKQNGQSALDNMTLAIRAADSVVCSGSYYTTWPQGNPSDTLVISKNGSFTRFRFHPPTTSINGYLAEDFPKVSDLPNSDLSQTSLLCTLPTSNGIDQTISTGVVIMTDKDNPTGGVSVTAGGFTVNSVTGFKPTINISFNLAPGVSAGQRADLTLKSNSSTQFSTTVGLR